MFVYDTHDYGYNNINSVYICDNLFQRLKLNKKCFFGNSLIFDFFFLSSDVSRSEIKFEIDALPESIFFPISRE